MSSQSDKAKQLLASMLAPEMAQEIAAADTAKLFAGEIGNLAMSNVFETLWLREGLDRKSRSLVTLAMLIALRADAEMEVHFPAAVRNGATIAELEELIYHATGYAGFPAAASARSVAQGALQRAGMLDA